MRELSIGVTKHDHLQGDPNAACSFVEYGDYECPSCGEVQPTIKGLEAHFGSQNPFVFRNFPLREIHPWAEAAAGAAEFAGSHGKFWEMRSAIRKSRELGREHAPVTFGKTGLDQFGSTSQASQRSCEEEN